MSQTRFHRIIHWLAFSMPLAAAAISVLLLYASPSVACGPYCDMPGDRGGVAYYIDNAVACESTCDGTPDCAGWTWVKPGLQGPQAVCWIKKQIVSTRRSNCCISGYRGDRTAAASVRQFAFDPGDQRALPPASGPPTTTCRWGTLEGGLLGQGSHFGAPILYCLCGGYASPDDRCGPRPRR
jgi:hypothetical protein